MINHCTLISAFRRPKTWKESLHNRSQLSEKKILEKKSETNFHSFTSSTCRRCASFEDSTQFQQCSFFVTQEDTTVVRAPKKERLQWWMKAPLSKYENSLNSFKVNISLISNSHDRRRRQFFNSPKRQRLLAMCHWLAFSSLRSRLCSRERSETINFATLQPIGWVRLHRHESVVCGFLVYRHNN